MDLNSPMRHAFLLDLVHSKQTHKRLLVIGRGRMAEPTTNSATSTVAGELGSVAKEKLCRRCKRSYDPAKNSTSSCRFHPSFFVCRRHDDQKRYYELGPDDPPYAAKFYDCCGAEDPDALGCTTDFHVSYDDH